MVLSFQRKYKQIVEEFDKKAKFEIISDHNIYLLIAKARVKCGDNKGALRDLTKALRIKNNDPQIFLQRGICFENLLDWKSAIREFTEAITLYPTFAKAYYHRGVCQTKLSKNGLTDLDMALKLDKKHFDAYLTRAFYHHSHGHHDKGIEDCNNALKLEPTSIRAHLLRGSCRCMLKEYEAALSDFSKAIQSDKVSLILYFCVFCTKKLLTNFIDKSSGLF